jgi:hypothetical protein
LLEAQSRVKHGEWTGWVQENCNFGARTAQNYLLLARHRAELEEYMSKNETDSFLTVRAALSLIHIDGLARDPAAEEPEHEEPATEELESESQAKYERELEREMSRGAAGAVAPCITDLERYAHTRPFKCAPSYDPDEEEAQESPADESFEELIEKLGATLLDVSRIVNKVTAKLEAAPEQYHLDQSFPPILAATIKNLRDFEQALRRLNSEAEQNAAELQ